MTGFVLRGQALRSIQRLKLYRDRFDDFESYCESVFNFSRLYIDRCMVAAETYYAIESYLKTNTLEDPKPNKQSQLRPIFQAHFAPIEAGEVWVLAVKKALGKVPTFEIVKLAVREYLQGKNQPLNPFSVGEICRIKSGVTGKNNCWCVVAEVKGYECVVDTWNSQYTVAMEDLEFLGLSQAESDAMLDLGVRMTAIAEVEELDDAVLWLLQGLERLNRATLNTLEERLLRVIEEAYGLSQQ